MNKDDVVEGDVDIPTEPAGKTMQLPAEVALLPIRNRVLLPGGLLRLTIGRPKSVSFTDAFTCNYVYVGDQFLGSIHQSSQKLTRRF